MSCILAANEFFENVGVMESTAVPQNDDKSRTVDTINNNINDDIYNHDNNMLIIIT